MTRSRPPRDPGRPLPPDDGWADERWAGEPWAEDAPVTDRRSEGGRADDAPRDEARGDDEWARDARAWQPREPRRQPLWATARLAGLLAVALVVLVGAALLVPGLARPDPTPRPSGAQPSASAVVGGPSTSAAPSFVRPTPTPQPTFATWVVRAGDSLNSIARQFDTTARSIAFWNREAYPTLDPESEEYAPNIIQVGWTLRVLPGVEYDEAGAPTPTPGGPTPAPVTPPPTQPTATPPPTTGGPAVVVSHGPRGTNRIALTFDMGGRLDPAVDIMTFLVEHRVRATIFPTGKQGTEHPQGRAAIAIVRDHPELFELANHSWDHPAFTDLTPDEMRAQLARSEEALLAYVGRTTKPFFRPPYGSWNRAVRDVVGGAGWGTIAMWDIDTIDWRPTSEGGPTANDIEAKVLANAQGGSIVLMHLGGWNTLDALPDILSGLRAKGLEPVTLGEMLGT